MDSKEIIDAAQRQLPVVYNGKEYKEILEYVLWFDRERNKQRSVILLDKSGNSTARVPASKISLAEQPEEVQRSADNNGGNYAN